MTPTTTKTARRLLVALVGTAFLTMVPGAMAQDEEDCERGRGPLGIRASVSEEGILVEWDPVDGEVLSYELHRTGGGQDETFFLDENTTSYLDSDVEAGVTYTYEVTAFVDQAPSLPGGTTLIGPCGSASSTAIPVFPTFVAGGLAALAGVVGYAALGRRR